MSVSKCRVVLQLRPSGVAKTSARSEPSVVRIHHIPRTIDRDCPDRSCGQSARSCCQSGHSSRQKAVQVEDESEKKEIEEEKESEQEESEEDGDLELAWGSSSCAGEAFQHLFQARYSLEP